MYFSKALFEGLIFGGAHIWRGLSMEGYLHFKIDWASLIVGSKFTVLALFYFVFKAIFQEQPPGRGRSRGRVQGVRTPPEMTCGFLIQLVFCKKKIWFIGVEVKSKRRVHPLPKEILDPPLPGMLILRGAI